jgi:hypothetical protein
MVPRAGRSASVLVVVVTVRGVAMALVHVVGVVTVADRGVLAVRTVPVRVGLGHLGVKIQSVVVDQLR